MVSALLVGSCSSGDADAVVDDVERSSVLDINRFALGLIEDHGKWPDTVDGRRMFILHQALYETWAVFDDEATGSLPDSGHRSLVASFEDPDVDAALWSAGAFVIEDLFGDDDDAVAAIDTFRSDHGLTDTKPGVADEAGLGARIALMVLEDRIDDGANEAFRYRSTPADGDRTEPNPASFDSDLFGWQPLVVPTGTVTDEEGKPVIDVDQPDSRNAQAFETAHWGDVTTHALVSGDEFRPAAPESPPRQRESGGYVDELLALASAAPDLDDSAKAGVAIWTDRSSVITWNELTVELAERRDLTGDETLRLLYAVNAAIHDTYVATWDAKRAYDSPRPITEVQRLLVDGETVDWAGDEVDPLEWAPYQDLTEVSPASPSVVGEQVAVTAAVVTVIEHFVGDESFDGSIAVQTTGDWVPGPNSPTTLTWITFDDAVDSAVDASVDGGVVLTVEAEEGRVLGERIGSATYRLVVKLWSGVA